MRSTPAIARAIFEALAVTEFNDVASRPKSHVSQGDADT
jgi:hypothetical protein